MHGSMRQLVLLAAAMATMTLPASTHASPKEEAKKHFDRAIDLVDDGHLNDRTYGGTDGRSDQGAHRSADHG